MKTIYTKYRFLCANIAFVLTFLSCTPENPFAGLDVTLSTDYINHVVSVNVLDSNPEATDPYPKNVTITLSGDSVDNGLIYSYGGSLLTSDEGSAVVTSNIVNLAVKPYTTISPDNPLKFRIQASAPGFSTNSKQITISYLDSIKYVDLNLLNIKKLPTGVGYTATVVADIGAILADTDVVIEVEESSSNEVQVVVTISSGTAFFDEESNPVESSGASLEVATEAFDNSDNAIANISGGLSAVQTNSGSEVSFTLGAAVDIVASIGNVNVTSFSTPLVTALNIGTTYQNPSTGTAIQAGDTMEVWSKNANSDIWNSEGQTTVELNAATGKLRVLLNIDHLSTWMVGGSSATCSDDLVLNYSSVGPEEKAILIEVFTGSGANISFLKEQTQDIRDGDQVIIENLPNKVCTLKVYNGSLKTDDVISTVEIAACATSAAVTNTLVNTNPILFFDLATKCTNGTFRYSGPIKYKVSGTTIWQQFTPSDDGRLTTQLLEWNETYDFKITYNNAIFGGERQVLESQFRLENGIWEFFGRRADGEQTTFFDSPASCN
jgi:hypothetical protein